MEFDINRVYTSVSADEVKVGSKVIVADNLKLLKERIAENNTVALCDIRDESYATRFVVSKYCPSALCYLISPPEEKKLKWTDLKIGDVIRKKEGTISYLVTGIDTDPSTNKHIFTDGIWCLDSELEEWEKVEE